MNMDILRVFEKMPQALTLYETLEQRILREFANVHIKAGKTQISFTNWYGFAYAWPPAGRAGIGGKVCLGISFGLAYKLEHARIFQSVEPYPNRWTHHVLIEHIDEIDNELIGWLRESYDFSMSKR